MAFKYACFISYCHGQHDLVTTFMDQLKEALKAELEPLLDEEVFIDEERLKPGYRYNETLATAICQSVCMVVVYSPRYEQHEYCVREYAAMTRLDTERRRLLGEAAAAGAGFIIPIILRGEDDVPPWIAQHQQCCDFSRFTLASQDLSRNPEYARHIRQIAAVIFEHYKTFRKIQVDPCAACLTFQLPPASDVAPWRPAFVNR